MKKLLILLVPVIAALSSCTTVNKTAKTVDISASIRNASVADLDVAPHRVTYTMTPSKAVRRGGLDNIKRVAESEALEKNGGGDVLVNPEFTVTKRHGLFGSKVTSVSVSGRPAHYTNVRSLPDSVWCNPVFRGMPQYGVSTRSKGVAHQPKAEKKDPAFAAAYPKKKWTHMVRVGVGSNTLAMGIEFPEFEERMGSRTGFLVGYEANRTMGRKGAYYGFDVTFASRGYKMDTPYDWDKEGVVDPHGSLLSEGEAERFDQLQKGVHATPLILGWKINVAKDWALDPHFGVYLGGNFSGNGTLFDGAFDSGWKLGFGVWFKKKFAIDFTYQGSFINTEAEYTTLHKNWHYNRYTGSYYTLSERYEYCNIGHASNCMVRLTYAF